MGRHRGDVETPQTPAIRAGKGGIEPPTDTRFGGPRANPGNPGGFPKGFVPLSRAYAIVGTMPIADVKKLARGVRPKTWGKRKLTVPYVTAARMWLTGSAPTAEAIADRTEGKVKNTTDLNVSAPDLSAAYLQLAKKRGLA